MRKVTLSCGLIFVIIVVFSLDIITAAERDPNVPALEGTLLSPVGAIADTTQYVVSISDDLLCGVSQGALKYSKKIMLMK